eukprot:Clim_evm52s232 gene=Clim_evmTU52s232
MAFNQGPYPPSGPGSQQMPSQGFSQGESGGFQQGYGYNNGQMGSQPGFGSQQGGPQADYSSGPFPQSGMDFGMNPAAQFAMNQIGAMGGKTMQEYGQYVSTGANTMKYYFQVDNAYVLSKLRLIFLPVRHPQGSWARQQQQHQQQGGPPVQFKYPRDDVNAPDLYIPLMAAITLILTIGFTLGMQDNFTPEIVGSIGSTIIAWLIVEIIVYYLCFHILNLTGSAQLLDIVAYAGYKYVGMNCIVISKLGGEYVHYAVAGYIALVTAWFTIQNMRLTILADPSGQAGNMYGRNSTRNYFLIVIGIVQALLSYYLTLF